MSGPETQVVWKYPLALTEGEQLVEVPVQARLVHFAMQRSAPTMWLLAEGGGRATTVRKYLIRGTGISAPAEPDAVYRGTTQDGPFVWHLFEVFGVSR